MTSFRKHLQHLLLTICLICLMAEVVFCQLAESEKEEILNEHNRLRGKVTPTASNMERLIWSDVLAQAAQSFAEQCVIVDFKSQSQHIIGVNMAVRTGPADYIEDINNWYNEAADYTYDTNSCKEGAVCGYYAQVVWATTRYIGCGAVRCDRLHGYIINAVNLVCIYGEIGDFIKLKPYMSGPSCSACPADLPSCVDNLCSTIEAKTTPVTATRATTPIATVSATTRFRYVHRMGIGVPWKPVGRSRFG